MTIIDDEAARTKRFNERLHTAQVNARPGRVGIRGLFSLKTDAEKLAMVEQFAKEHGLPSTDAYGEGYTTASRKMQAARTEMKLLYVAYINEVRKVRLRNEPQPYPPQIQKDLDTDPLDFIGAGTAINVERAKDFFFLLATQCQPRRIGHEVLSQNHIKSKRDLFFIMVSKAILDAPDAAFNSILTVVGAKGDYERSFYGQVNTAVCCLIDTHKLVYRAEERVSYGRPEYELIQQELFASLMSSHGGNISYESNTGALTVMAISHVVGWRGGTTCATDPGDDALHGMDGEDVLFRRKLVPGAKTIEECPHAWHLELNGRHFKGFQRADNRLEVVVDLPPVERVQNLCIEVQVFLFAHVIKQRRLHPKGKPHELITNVQELMDTDATELVVTPGPLFRTRSGGYVSESNMTGIIRNAAISAGLPPTGGLHCFRRDVGTMVNIAMGPAIARHILNHGIHNDSLHRYYAPLKDAVNLVTFRSCEGLTPNQRAQLEQANWFAKQWEGSVRTAGCRQLVKNGQLKPNVQLDGPRPEPRPPHKSGVTGDFESRLQRALLVFSDTQKWVDKFNKAAAPLLLVPKSVSDFNRDALKGYNKLSSRALTCLRKRVPKKSKEAKLVKQAKEACDELKKLMRNVHKQVYYRNVTARAIADAAAADTNSNTVRLAADEALRLQQDQRAADLEEAAKRTLRSATTVMRVAVTGNALPNAPHTAATRAMQTRSSRLESASTSTTTLATGSALPNAPRPHTAATRSMQTRSAHIEAGSTSTTTPSEPASTSTTTPSEATPPTAASSASARGQDDSPTRSPSSNGQEGSAVLSSEGGSSSTSGPASDAPSQAVLDRLFSTPYDPSLIVTDQGFGGQDAFVTAAARLWLIDSILKLDEGNQSLQATIDLIGDGSICGICTKTEHGAPPETSIWPSYIDPIVDKDPQRFLSQRRTQVRKHIQNVHPDHYIEIISGKPLNPGFLAPHAPFYIPDMIQQYAPEVSDRFVIPPAVPNDDDDEEAERLAWNVLGLPSLWCHSQREQDLAEEALVKLLLSISPFAGYTYRQNRQGRYVEWAMCHEHVIPRPGKSYARGHGSGDQLLDKYKRDLKQHVKSGVPYAPTAWILRPLNRDLIVRQRNINDDASTATAVQYPLAPIDGNPVSTPAATVQYPLAPRDLDIDGNPVSTPAATVQYPLAPQELDIDGNPVSTPATAVQYPLAAESHGAFRRLKFPL